MKLENLLLLFLGLFLYDLYYDHYILNLYKKYKKYGLLVFYIFLAFSFYLMIKKNPTNSYHLVNSLKGLIHHAPIDKDAKELFTPLLNIPSLNNLYMSQTPYDNIDPNISSTPQFKRMLNSGSNTNKSKRSVSETKKKYVASCQNWKCKSCGNQLQAWFEVDHIMPLYKGGTNNVDNLVALCRNCHGEKTAMEYI